MIKLQFEPTEAQIKEAIQKLNERIETLKVMALKNLHNNTWEHNEINQCLENIKRLETEDIMCKK